MRDLDAAESTFDAFVESAVRDGTMSEAELDRLEAERGAEASRHARISSSSTRTLRLLVGRSNCA